MTCENFWEIIEDVHRASAGDMEAKCELLRKKLRQLPSDEVRSFADWFSECNYRAYTWELWAAAYIIGGGCSDDSFWDFRSTLISMGRETFEAALADPQSLADRDYDANNSRYEGYQYVAGEIYREKNRGRPLQRSQPHPARPSGQDWEESKVGMLYPKVAAKYHYKDWPG